MRDGGWIWPVAVVGLIWWAASDSGNSSTSAESAGDSAYASDSDDSGDSDLYDTDADTSGLKGSETYDDFDSRRDDLDGSAGVYEGYGCTQDCSGHDAGYQWAEDHGVTDESECGGKSWSFEEGCVAFAQEQSEDDSESDDSEDESDQP